MNAKMLTKRFPFFSPSRKCLITDKFLNSNYHNFRKTFSFNSNLVMVVCYQNQNTVRKNCSSDRVQLLKFEAKGREFAKFLRSLEQFIQTVKGQNNFW